ncbi:MAG: hypothetical protein R3F39_11395 [Myxococcota bacterium]
MPGGAVARDPARCAVWPVALMRLRERCPGAMLRPDSREVMGRFSGAMLLGSMLAVVAPSTARATPESLGAVHLGVDGGYGWLSSDLDLTGRRSLRAVPDASPLAGLRIGVGLGRIVSLEVGGWLLPASLRRAHGDALVVGSLAELVFHALRGPVSLSWSAGVGALSLAGGDLGRDADLLMSAGMGVRYLFAARRLAVRLDVRAWFTDGAEGTLSVSPVVTAGLDVYLRRSVGRATPTSVRGAVSADRDGDGFTDDVDRCPEQRGAVANAGCPDRDGDGVADPEDRCPDHVGDVGLAGCPDSDGDGVADPKTPALPWPASPASTAAATGMATASPTETTGARHG